MPAPTDTTAAAFGAQIIGRTEKALNAILERQLADTDITEPQWVALTLTVINGETMAGDTLIARISDALKVNEAAVRQRNTELSAANLVRITAGGTVEATDEGRMRWSQIRAATTQITQQLWGDLPEADLAVAGRVLNTVLIRVNALLSAT